MARANRHYIPGYVWHITHRCHQKEFLLKFARDRKRWIDWLFEAKKRYGLTVLNYMVTYNHVHLLVYDNRGRESIPKSIQLIAGRTGQGYNLRKQRRGAFWEDRYHATAIEKGSHLKQCLVYIDLNMVRAGVVDHPQLWPFCGYNEIQNPPQRYRIIDLDSLTRLLGISNPNDFQSTHKRWVAASLSRGEIERERDWTQSIAVGGKAFVEKFKESLGFR
ncbi:MAG: transposase, partial [Desulfobacterales bacterium]